MRRFVNPGKRIASFTRTFARLRWALGFDNIGIRGQLATRAINPDGDIDIEFYAPSNIVTTTCIMSQNISSNSSLMEFRLLSYTNQLQIVVGGMVSIILSGATGYEAGAKFRVLLVGTTITIWKTALENSDTPIRTLSFTRGTAREPAAITVVGAETFGTIGSYARYFVGIQRDVKINGVRWPMADRNQAIQLPQPSGLGAELITQSVLENPVAKGGQWTYLGGGRWEYIGDGTSNSLQFLNTASHPEQGYFEFEMEYITGVGQLNCTAQGVTRGIFTSAGIKRLFYTSLAEVGSIRFTRAGGTTFSCVIKNISFKPLGSCNPMTISNATSANWMQVVDDYVAKFRKVLRFDGVGIRGIAGLKAIDIATDFDLAWSLKGVTKGRWQSIVAQNIMPSNNNREFSIELSNTNNIAILLGGVTYTRSTINYTEDGNYRLTRVGSTAYLYKNGALVEQFTANSGAVREDSALFSVGIRHNGSISMFSSYLQGVIYNVKINGTLWPIADSTQSIQLPEPSGLGAELITQAVLENPFNKGSHWTYLGNGRWEYVGDGSLSPLEFIAQASQPVGGFVEFEIESITAGTALSCTNGSIGSSVFTTVGVKRFYYTDINSPTTFASKITFKRNVNGVPMSCIIKNISFKPLGTCNPITLANVTSANWEDLEI